MRISDWSSDVCSSDLRFIFVNSPGSPTGWTMDRDQQRAILDFARANGIWIIADEVYARIVYDRKAAPSFLEIAEPDDPLLVVNSFSKTWAMTGWRVGWLTHPAGIGERSEEHTSELQSLMRISYAVFCLKKKK